MRIHQGTASSSSLRASVQSAVFDVRGNTSTWVARRSSRHNRAAAPAGSCWPAAAPLLSSLSGECRPSSLCAGGGMQVVYHWPHRAQALRHHTLPVRRRLVLILQLSGPTFAQRGKLQASALRGTSRKCVREAAASALLHLISHRPRPGHLRPRHHGVHDCRRHHHHHLGLRRCHQHLCCRHHHLRHRRHLLRCRCRHLRRRRRHHRHHLRRRHCQPRPQSRPPRLARRHARRRPCCCATLVTRCIGSTRRGAGATPTMRGGPAPTCVRRPSSCTRRRAKMCHACTRLLRLVWRGALPTRHALSSAILYRRLWRRSLAC